MTIILIDKHIIPLLNPKLKSVSQAIRELPFELIDKIYEYTKDYKKVFDNKFYSVLNSIKCYNKEIIYGYFFKCYPYRSEKYDLLRSLRQRFGNVCCHHSLKSLDLQILGIPMYKYILYRKVFENKREVITELYDIFDKFKHTQWRTYCSSFQDEKKNNWNNLTKIAGIPKGWKYKKITNKKIVEELNHKKRKILEFSSS